MFAPTPINFRYGTDPNQDEGLRMVLQQVGQRNALAQQSDLMQQDQANKLQLAAALRQGSSPTSGQYFTNQNPVAQSVLQAKQAWRNGAGIADEDLTPAQKSLEENPNFAFRDYQQTMQPIVQQKIAQQKQSALENLTAVKKKILDQATPHIHPDMLPEVAAQVDDEKTTPNQFAAKITGAVKETQRLGQQKKEEAAKGQIWQSNVGWMNEQSPESVDELHALVTDGHTSSAQLLGRIQGIHRGLVKEKVNDLKAFEKEHLGIDFDPSQPPTQFVGPDGKVDTKRAGIYGEWVQKHNELQKIAHPQNQATPNGGQQTAPMGQAKQLDRDTALKFYQQAGGDPAKARQLAQQAGYSF